MSVVRNSKHALFRGHEKNENEDKQQKNDMVEGEERKKHSTQHANVITLYY